MTWIPDAVSIDIRSKYMATVGFGLEVENLKSNLTPPLRIWGVAGKATST